MVQYIVPDDYPDIQSAIDAVPVDEFGDIYAREDTYTLNPEGGWPPNQIIARPNLLLRGDGIDKTIIEMTPNGINPVRADVITSFDDIINLTLQDLTVNQKAVPDNAGSSSVYLRTGNHKDIKLRRVKSINSFGAGFSIPRTIGLLIEDCISEIVWTGITLAGCDTFTLRRNTIKNTTGNAIYPGWNCINGLIENNHIDSAGDLAIDITSNIPNPPNQNIEVKNNKIFNGHLRVTNAINIYLYNNDIVYGFITVDSGQAVPINIKVDENNIMTDRDSAIRFAGAQQCSAFKNKITMLPPSSELITQVGIRLAIRGYSIIESNEIYGARDFGIDFANWGLGGDSDMTIRNNKIVNFGDLGIYDNAKNQGRIKIIENEIYSDVPTARLGILTEYTDNIWSIEKNGLKVKELAGDKAIYAPSSTLLDNYEYTPKSSLWNFLNVVVKYLGPFGTGLYIITRIPKRRG